MDARHLAFADAGDGNVTGAFQLGAYVVSNGDSRTARRIQLVDVVGLLHTDTIAGVVVHQPCQLTVYRTEQRHAHAVVAAPEEGVTPDGRTQLTQLGLVLAVPAGGAAHHLHALRKGSHHVVVGHGRHRELDGHVSAAEGIAIEVCAIIHIDDAHHLVTAAASHLFQQMTHLAISN